MKIEITDLEQINAPFTMDITDFEQEGFDVYRRAHDTWGEENWHVMAVTHDGVELGRMLNSSTMVPVVVPNEDA
jgi:hypothetical protein